MVVTFIKHIYPIFLKLLQTNNHWVVDALIDENDPENFFKKVQPNSYIISECIKLLAKWKPGAIYVKILLIIFEILRISFEDPDMGFRLYPLSTNNINQIGKYLDESQAYDSPVNTKILHILDRISSVNRPGGLPPKTEEMGKVATQANNIRGKFLDPAKHLSESIPYKILARGDSKKAETPPSNQ